MKRPSFDQAPCKGKSEMFFLNLPYSKEERKKEQEAKKICAGCDMIEMCLLYSLYHEEYGMWGGMSERQRSALRKELKIHLVHPQAEVMESMRIEILTNVNLKETVVWH